MARERSPKGRSRNKPAFASGRRGEKRKSGWVKPDGTPLRKRKGEYFPDQEIDKRKPSGRRNSGATEFSRKDNDSRNSSGEKPFRRNREQETNNFRERSETRTYEKKDRTENNFNRDSRNKRSDRPFEKRDRPEKSSFRERTDAQHEKRDDRPFEKRDRAEKSSFRNRSDNREKSDDRPFEKRDRTEKSSYRDRSDAQHEKRDDRYRDKIGPRKEFTPRTSSDKREFRSDEKRDRSERGSSQRGFRDQRGRSDKSSYAKRDRNGRDNFKKFEKKSGKSSSRFERQDSQVGGVRLNKYIANAGICSRREADDLITAGVISINGNIVTELGTKVMPGDVVKYHDRALKTEKLVYVLLNKPKDYITTTDDPGERKTVMNLVSDAGKERIFPVGRLDRNTTGLLLITNDGELTKKLTHPSSNITKVYQVELDRNITREDMIRATEGVELEDGIASVDQIHYTAPDAKNIVGVELHSGRNRVVRRIFESMDYRVLKLDRVTFAGLTKKDLPRGRWRFLTEMEVNMLKMLTGRKKNN